jgi:putative ABC transport system permease protein
MLKRLLSFSRAALGRDTFERDMEEEIRFHVASRTADLIRRGLPPDEAARRARVEFGSVEKHKEESRASFGLRLLDEAGGDARYALRTFARNKAFTATAIVTLALGIGANTAIFSLLDALLLRWLPVPNPQALVQVRFKSDTPNSFSGIFSYAAIQALDTQRQIFSGVAGFSSFDFGVGTPGSTARVPGALVTGSFYETLGLNPVAGRLLTRDDDRPGAPLVAVASYGYWERQLARDPSVAGRTVILNGVPATIVGVSPRGFVGAHVGLIADLTIPVATVPLVVPEMAGVLGPGNYWLRALARPQPGLSTAAAQAQIAARWPRIAEAVVAPHWPADRQKATIDAVVELVPGGTGWTYLREMYVRPLQVLMAMVGLVLVIACANVASLLLARAAARQKEIAVRLAIGAGRGRIVRQLLVESLVLSVAGAAGGILLASMTGRFLLDRLSTGPSAVALDLTPNWHVLAFTGGVAIVTAILFGLAPALQATGFGPSRALKEEARSTASRSRLLPWLVTAQVALSLVLLVGAGLFVRSLRNLQRFDAGFARAGVLLVEFDGKRPAWSNELLEEIRLMPGVAAASVSTHTPLSGSTWSEAVVPAGQPLPNGDNAVFIGAGPEFFTTMRIPVLSGREFTGRDSATSTAVAVVNERYAQKHFPGQNPVGRHLTARLSGAPRDLEIVGLVKNTNTQSLRSAPPAIVYLPFEQLPGNRAERAATLEIRTAGGLGEVIPTVRQALQSRFPDATVNVSPLSAQVDASIVQERMMATLAGGFGLLALGLASVGIYGLLAYGVARRTKEIGIHMALGAQRRKVIALVLRGARRSLVIGLAIGLPLAVAGSRWVESMLFGLKPTDPVAIVAAVLLLATVAHLAAYVPALRASRVDPLVALRHE